MLSEKSNLAFCRPCGEKKYKINKYFVLIKILKNSHKQKSSKQTFSSTTEHIKNFIIKFLVIIFHNSESEVFDYLNNDIMGKGKICEFIFSQGKLEILLNYLLSEPSIQIHLGNIKKEFYWLS